MAPTSLVFLAAAAFAGMQSALGQVVTTLAGTPVSGNQDGTGPAAAFHGPFGVKASVDGRSLFAVDFFNNEIRQIDAATGDVTTLAGAASGAGGGYLDGPGALAKFNTPNGVAPDADGCVFVADYTNNLIRQIVVSTQVVSTLAGNVAANPAGGYADGTGLLAIFQGPADVVADASGNLFVLDQRLHPLSP